jgi:hypothetical protein
VKVSSAVLAERPPTSFISPPPASSSFAFGHASFDFVIIFLVR